MLNVRIPISLSLLVCALISVSCSWMAAHQVTPHPDDFKTPSGTEKSATIHFNFYPPHIPSNGIKPFQRGLEDNPTVKEAVYISEAPKEGLFCSITIEIRPGTPLFYTWAYVSGISLGMIPFWDVNGIQRIFTYKVYVNGNFSKSYQYVSTIKSVFWIGLPLLKPFLSSDWTNSVANGEDYDKAIIGTGRAFWLDAHADGLF
jgi:hypothetical protein